MKLKYVVVMLLIVLCACITACACDGSHPEESSISNDSSTQDNEYLSVDSYFDFEKTRLPSVLDFENVKFGMTLSEVISVVGKPHDFGPTSGLCSVEWETAEGEKLYTIICYPEDVSDDIADKNTLLTLLKHGVTTGIEERNYSQNLEETADAETVQ